jgi:Na+-driven multidrug efflux pump
MAVSAEELGTEDIKKLLIKQAAPASMDLFMSVNILIDTIFVGQWIGSFAIGCNGGSTDNVPDFIFNGYRCGGGSVLGALGAKTLKKSKTTLLIKL